MYGSWIAGAQFDDWPGRAGGIFFQRSGHDSNVAHPGIDPAQIAPGTQRARVIGRQRVENFGLDETFHAPLTSKIAPWQLKPAPKADIHHQPSGTVSFKARSRTKKTVGLLTLPNSRRTAELWRTSDSVNLSRSRNDKITSRPPACKIQPVISSRFIFAAASDLENNLATSSPAIRGTWIPLSVETYRAFFAKTIY